MLQSPVHSEAWQISDILHLSQDVSDDGIFIIILSTIDNFIDGLETKQHCYDLIIPQFNINYKWGENSWKQSTKHIKEHYAVIVKTEVQTYVK